MKFSYTLSASMAVALASASPHMAKRATEWAPGGADDFRGPCPMMNTLANHGFLPHDGRNITRENAIKALGEGINFDATLAGIMWDQAIIANPEANATFFTLDQLNVHNVLEHDASLSREDAFFGNNHVFNQTVFSTSTAYWTETVLLPQHIADSKLARQITSRNTNPEYRFTTSIENFSIGEIAAPFLVFGSIPDATVDRDTVISFFQNEKLPDNFTPQTSAVTLDQILQMSEVLRNATNLFTVDPVAAAKVRRSTKPFGHGLSF